MSFIHHARLRSFELEVGTSGPWGATASSAGDLHSQASMQDQAKGLQLTCAHSSWSGIAEAYDFADLPEGARRARSGRRTIGFHIRRAARGQNFIRPSPSLGEFRRLAKRSATTPVSALRVVDLASASTRPKRVTTNEVIFFSK